MVRTDRPTYPELLNFYYRSGFPSILKASANSVAHGIMFKWNQLYMPDVFRMSNVELSYLSGIDSHIGRSRQKVIDECKINETPLFSYVSNGRQRAGTYRINCTLLPNSTRTQPKVSQNSAKTRTIWQGSKLNGTEQNKTHRGVCDFLQHAKELMEQHGILDRSILRDFKPKYICNVIERPCNEGTGVTPGQLVNQIKDADTLKMWNSIQ